MKQNKMPRLFMLFITVLTIFSIINTGLINTISVFAESKSLSIIEDNVSKNKMNDGKYIVKLKEGIAKGEKEKLLKKYDLKEIKLGSVYIETNRFLSTDVSKLVDEPNIELIEEDGVVEVQTLNFNDPLSKEQWYLEAIGYNVNLESNLISTEEKTIAVIDSGICAEHEDLKNRVIEGWNFINDNSDTNDILGHGCAVSGVIAANTDNNTGIVGASNNTKIMSLKVIDENGLGDYSSLINAIDYATAKDVDIINISLGGYFESPLLKEAINKAYEKGIVIVASAGNTGNEEIMYPAKFSEVISVGSVENDYTISTFSSNSEDVDVWTYGSNITSLKDSNKYITESGTSLSAALATGFISKYGIPEYSKVLNLSNPIDPIFHNLPITIKEPKSNLSFDIPKGITYSEFESPTRKGSIINWEITINLSLSESLTISVWYRDSEKELVQLLKDQKSRYECNKDICLYNYPNEKGEYAVFNTFIKQDTNLIRIRYLISDFIGLNNYEKIAKSFKLNDKSFNKTLSLDTFIDKANLSQAIIPQVASCGGFTDTNNEFPCCSSSWEPLGDYHNANCTWYARYKRPDLKGKVTGDAGSWYQEAIDHEVATANSSSIPVPGSIIVWSGHVAYVESVNESNGTVTWSEQNCMTYYWSGGQKVYAVNPYNASVTRAYQNSYGGTLYGYILPPGSSNTCNGLNPVMTNWNVGSTLTCSPSGTLTIKPESNLISSNSNQITIKPN